MCGIAGLYLPENATVIDANLDAMMAVLRHRGPDGDGRYVSPDRRFQLGFTRLAIIDLENGDQPLIDGEAGTVMAGNGEIYNYLELRESHADFPYRTTGDMECVLALDRRYGDGLVDHLNGMYGLAVYRRAGHELLLVRDRLGVKPLYWTRLMGGGILFASEVKALLASGLVTPSVDEGAVSSYLAHGYVPAPNTLFSGIRKLPPGHFLKTNATGGVETVRYWRAETASELPDGEEAIAEELTRLVSDSVRLQMRSDVPIGALLSGGIDSGLVVALAARHLDRPVKTFTVRFPSAAVDETPLAAQVAERYGTDHQVLEVGAADVAAYLPRLAWFCDEPVNDPALLPNFLVEEALGRHVKVALNGTGGDELFAGYGRHFRTPVEARYLGMPSWLRQHVVEPMVGAFSPMTAWRLARAEKFDNARGDYLHDHTGQFPEPIRRLIGNRLVPPASAQSIAYSEFKGPDQSAALAADLATYLPDDLLILLDRTSMAVGVEGRVPFLDHRLVGAALSVSPEIRTPGGRQKGLERRMAEPFLPRDVLDAPKQGFASPVPAWIEGGLGTLAKRILTRKQTLERGWWDAQGVERLLANPKRHGFRLYSLLMLELTVRVHVEAAPVVRPSFAGLEEFADAA